MSDINDLISPFLPKSDAYTGWGYDEKLKQDGTHQLLLEFQMNPHYPSEQLPVFLAEALDALDSIHYLPVLLCKDYTLSGCITGTGILVVAGFDPHNTIEESYLRQLDALNDPELALTACCKDLAQKYDKAVCTFDHSTQTGYLVLETDTLHLTDFLQK